MGKKDKKNKKGDKTPIDSAPEQAEGIGAELSAPEKLVGDGTPRIDYPRYRVEPGRPINLSDVNPTNLSTTKTTMKWPTSLRRCA